MEESTYFRHCDKPTLNPNLGTVKGVIPDWLNGTLIRNGAGIRHVGKDTYNHIFDGLAIIHRYHIQHGQVTYNSRQLDSEAYKRAVAAERIVMTEFGTLGIPDPCDSYFAKFKSLFIAREDKPLDDEFTDNCAVNVGFYGDQLYAMTETMFIRRISPDTLETVGERTRITDYVTVNTATAHPHVLHDGTVLNMGSNFRHNKGPHYCIIQVPPSYDSEDTVFTKAKILLEIPCSLKLYPSYYHSFAITQDKIILIEQPLYLSMPRFLMSKFIRRNTIQGCLSWKPNIKTKFKIASSKTGKIHPIVYETDDLCTFHHANAYEENGNVIVDLVGYDDPNFLINGESMKFRSGKNGKNKPTLRRYILPLDGSKIASIPSASIRPSNHQIIDISPTILYNLFFEFPRINYKYNGRKYKFVYGATSTKQEETETFSELDQLAKVDVDSGEINCWSSGNSYTVSEPVFVANPIIENPTEDDGVVLANLLHKGDPEKTTLIILNAKNMREIGRVFFKADGVVTSTFHGQWSHMNDLIHLY